MTKRILPAHRRGSPRFHHVDFSAYQYAFVPGCEGKAKRYKKPSKSQ